MGFTAFFTDDILGLSDTTRHVHPDCNRSDAPLANAVNDRPRSLWLQEEYFFFMIDSGLWMDLNEGSGERSVKLAHAVGNGHYIANHLETNLNASPLTTLTYRVTWIGARFEISAVNGAGSPTAFSMLFSSGSHGTSQPRQMLGFANSDYSGASSYTSPELRYGTDFWAVFEAPTLTEGATAQNTDAFALVVEAGPDAAINTATKSLLRVYSHTSLLSLTDRADWESSATAYTFSPRNPISAYSSSYENHIQVAKASNGANIVAKYYAFSWRYYDEEPYHAVGLLKALKKRTSTSRQVAELQGHGLVDPSTSIGVNSYFPVQQMMRWRTSLTFDMWQSSDFRNVVQKPVLAGRSKALLWSLRWDEIASGSKDAEDEAAVGFLFWGAITDYSLDNYAGSGSDFISADLVVEQVR